MFGMLAAIGAVAAACYAGVKMLNKLSEREQRRQQELMDNHDRYRHEANRRYAEIHSQYASSAEYMREQALEKIREEIANAINETKEKNRPYYQKQLELCDEQLADVKESIEQCEEMLALMTEYESKEIQLTALRRNSLRQSRQNFIEAKLYYKSFEDYLKRWRKCQEREFERRGELLEPFSIRLPERVPYKGRIIYCSLTDLCQEKFDLEVQNGISYPFICEDVTTLPIAIPKKHEIDTYNNQSDVEGKVPVLVIGKVEDKGRNGNPYTRYVVSYSKGKFMALLREHPDIAVDASIVEYNKNKSGKWEPVLEYCGVKMCYKPARGLRIKRKLPKGTRLKVYIYYYNRNLSIVYASNIFYKPFSPDVFHDIPIWFEEEDISIFVDRAKKLNLDSSTEDWQIGPFEQDMEEGFKVKCQLGHKFVFVARWRGMPFGEEYKQGLVLEQMLDPEEVFRLDDAYVLIDAVFRMQRLASLETPSESVKKWAQVSSELYTYLYQEFSRQARIKAENKEAIYYNHWTRLMHELCQEKEKGKPFTSNTFIVKRASSTIDKMSYVLVSPEEVDKYLTRCYKWLEKQQKRSGGRSGKKAEFFVIIKDSNGSERRINVYFANDYEELHFKHDWITPEELEIVDGELVMTVYLRNYPIPEYRQRDALESFRLSDITNPELKQLFFDLPTEEFSYNGRSQIVLENGGIYGNERQLQAVVRSLSDNALFFIQGPPGTGKTTVIREIIFQELKISGKAHIMVVSQSNVAVDNVLRGFVEDKKFDDLMVRCGNADSFSEELRNYDFYERLREYKEGVNEDITGELQSYRLLWRKMIADQDEAELINEYLLSDYQIVGVTCVGLANPHFGISKSNFDLVVIDEAGKAMPGELLLPINRAKKVVIIGDHKQLPPVVDPILCQDDVSLRSVKELSEEERLQFIGKSLFHRLYEYSHPSRRVMLNVQFRMPAIIGDFISKFFYDGELKNAPSVQYKVPLFLQHNMVLIDVNDDNNCYEEKTPDKNGLVNHREAEIVAQLVKQIRLYYNQRIVIITPYKRQKKIIRNQLEDFYESRSMLNVDTVDSFQGDEAPIVIYCTTRTRYCTDFFSDYARINVALSRTNNMLFIVASSAYLRKYTSKHQTHVLPALADYVEQNGVIMKSADIWNDNFDWEYNSIALEARKDHYDNKLLNNKKRYELSESEYMGLLPESVSSYDETQGGEKAACSKCGLVWPISQLTNGMCDICLHYDGKKIKCRACGKEIFFTNYEKYVLNKKTPSYCEKCAQLERNYPCNECGTIIHISPEQNRNIISKGLNLPELCRNCSEKKILDKYLCHQCGTRIYRNVHQIPSAIKSEIETVMYCKKCGDDILDKYLCNECGRRIYHNVNQILDIKESKKKPFVYCFACSKKSAGELRVCNKCGREFQVTLQEKYNVQSLGWVMPKHCPECRELRKHEKKCEKCGSRENV